MRVLSVFAVIAVVLLSGFVLARSDQSAQDDKAVREVIQSMEAAWNRRDGTAYGSAFSENGDLVLPNGLRVNGRKAIVNGQSLALKSIYAESRITAKIKSIRLLRPEVAIAHVTWILTYRMSGDERRLPTNSTITLAKGADGKWLVEAFQATPIL